MNAREFEIALDSVFTYADEQNVKEALSNYISLLLEKREESHPFSEIGFDLAEQLNGKKPHKNENPYRAILSNIDNIQLKQLDGSQIEFLCDWALVVIGKLLDKPIDTIIKDLADNQYHRYITLMEYLNELSTKDIKEFTDVAKITILRSPEFLNSLKFKLGYGITERLALSKRSFIHPTSNLDAQSITINQCIHVLITTLDRQSDTENITSTYVTKLMELIQELEELKNSQGKEHAENIDEINQYIASQKRAFDEVITVLKIKKNYHAIALLCLDADKAFDEYIRSLIVKAMDQDFDQLSKKNRSAGEMIKMISQLVDESRPDLHSLRNDLENEYLSYFTPGKNFGKYALRNPSLIFAKEIEEITDIAAKRLKSKKLPSSLQVNDESDTDEDIDIQEDVNEYDCFTDSELFFLTKRHAELKLQKDTATEFANRKLNAVYSNVINKFNRGTQSNVVFEKHWMELGTTAMNPGTSGHARSKLKSLQDTLNPLNPSYNQYPSLEKAKSFIETLKDIFIGDNRYPSSKPSNQRKKVFAQFKDDFCKPMEDNVATRYLNANGSTEYYKIYWQFENDNILVKAKSDMNSVYNTICSKLYFWGNKNPADIHDDIVFLLNSLKEHHSISDYIHTMEALADISQNLSDSRHPMCTNFREVIQNSIYQIVNSHFTQSQGPKLPITYNDMARVILLISRASVPHECNTKTMIIKKFTQKMFALASETHVDSVITPMTDNARVIAPQSDIQIRENRRQRFENSLYDLLLSHSIANWALLSGKIGIANTAMSNVAGIGAALVDPLIDAAEVLPTTKVLTAGVKIATTLQNQRRKQQSCAAASNSGEFISWLEFIKDFSKTASELFKSQIMEMVGNGDVERFAQLCHTRIAAALADKTQSFPAKKEERTVYMLKAIFNGSDNLNALPWANDCYHRKDDKSLRGKSSYQQMLKRVVLQSKNKDDTITEAGFLTKKSEIRNSKHDYGAMFFNDPHLAKEVITNTHKHSVITPVRL